MIFDSWVLINGNICKGKLTDYGIECTESFKSPISLIDLNEAITCVRNGVKLELDYVPKSTLGVQILYPKTVSVEAIPEWETIRTWYDL